MALLALTCRLEGQVAQKDSTKKRERQITACLLSEPVKKIPERLMLHFGWTITMVAEIQPRLDSTLNAVLAEDFQKRYWPLLGDSVTTAITKFIRSTPGARGSAPEDVWAATETTVDYMLKQGRDPKVISRTIIDLVRDLTAYYTMTCIHWSAG